MENLILVIVIISVCMSIISFVLIKAILFRQNQDFLELLNDTFNDIKALNKDINDNVIECSNFVNAGNVNMDNFQNAQNIQLNRMRNVVSGNNEDTLKYLQKEMVSSRRNQIQMNKGLETVIQRFNQIIATGVLKKIGEIDPNLLKINVEPVSTRRKYKKRENKPNIDPKTAKQIEDIRNIDPKKAKQIQDILTMDVLTFARNLAVNYVPDKYSKQVKSRFVRALVDYFIRIDMSKLPKVKDVDVKELECHKGWGAGLSKMYLEMIQNIRKIK